MLRSIGRWFSGMSSSGFSGSGRFVGVMSELHVNGFVEAGDGVTPTKVTGPTKVNGDLTATKAEFEGPAEVNGNARISSSAFRALATFNGNLDAKDSQFGDVQLTGSHQTFQACKVGKISVITSGPQILQRSPQITLTKGTQVEQLCFVGNTREGVVHLDGSSSVGTIENGRQNQTS